MNERDIFLAALEIADPDQRAAYMDQACGADMGLRSQVEELLRAHAQASQFLETPAEAADPSTMQTIVTVAEDADVPAEVSSAEAEFRRFLGPATRSGWLGRLAHYEIEKILGRGAFGIVAKAFDEKLHRVVAIKLMNPGLALTSPPRKRFLREARAAAAVTHENIVAIYAVEEEPTPYLVMEYIPGQTLQERMDAQGPFDITEVLKVGQHVAAGLAAAHAVNLVHRDIKPSNILMTGGLNDRAKISDFGLARAVDDATMTTSGVIAGTPMYMAPEQARGETLDHRADLFSLGSVLYQMTCGRPPFRAANTIAVLKRVCEDTPRPLADVLPGTPGWLETIVFKLLEKQREDRYQSSQEVADLLARCRSELQHQGQVTCVPGRTAETPDTQRADAPTEAAFNSRPRQIAFGLGALAAVLVIGWVVKGSLWPTIEYHYYSEQTSATTSAATTGATTGETTGETTTEEPTLPSADQPTVTAGWQGWPADAPPAAIAPFTAEQAREHQAQWAKYLQVPVEYTNSVGMKFRLIPPGEFMMGAADWQLDQWQQLTNPDYRESGLSAGPAQKVILTRPFYLGTTEVTQQQYASLAGHNPASFASTGNEKDAVQGLATEQFPVEGVNQQEASHWCRDLSEHEHHGSASGDSTQAPDSDAPQWYRLPTEAEWEFACRAGSQTAFWFGDDAESLVRVAWTQTISDRRPHEVGQLEANPFGLFDVYGNVWEWVQDRGDLGDYARRAGQPVIDPVVPFTPEERGLVRGGCWLDGKGATDFFMTSAYRRIYPSERNPYFGFRVALSVDAVRTALKNPPPAKMVPTVPADAIDYAAERKAAEWAISAGVTRLVIEDVDGNRSEVEQGRLPDKPFAVLELWFSKTSNPAMNDAGLANLAGCRRLTTLEIAGTPGSLAITDQGLLQLPTAAPLTGISVTNLPITEVSLAHLAALPNLGSLTLKNTSCTPEGFAILGRSPKLFRLTFLTDSQISDEILRVIGAHLPQLEMLTLHMVQSDKVTVEGIRAVADGCPKLWQIHIDNLRGVLPGLSGSQSLRSIHTNSQMLTAVDLAALSQLPHLEQISIYGIPTVEVCTGLKDLEHLVKLEYNLADGMGSLQPLTVLNGHPHLAELVVSNVQQLTVDDADALGSITNLQRLQFGLQAADAPDFVNRFRTLRPGVELVINGRTYPATAKPEEMDD